MVYISMVLLPGRWIVGIGRCVTTYAYLDIEQLVLHPLACFFAGLVLSVPWSLLFCMLRVVNQTYLEYAESVR